MPQLRTQHWHVAVRYPDYQDGYEDQPFEEIDGALDYANETRETFREDGHRVAEVDRPEDDVAGVIQRYQATEEEGATVAIIEVRPCHQEHCLPRREAHPLPFEVADSWQPLVESYPSQMPDIGRSKLTGRPLTVRMAPGRQG
jgi:hypothetical protein